MWAALFDFMQQFNRSGIAAWEAFGVAYLYGNAALCAGRAGHLGESLAAARSAAHPWCGMRNMASLIGSGVMDRYPSLRIGTLEAGHSWLPFWMARIDEHAETIKAALPTLRQKPSEYVLSGRYFQSIEIPEGEKLTDSVIDLLGEDALMYASDYPHGESRFPKSVRTVMGWTMSPASRRKPLWENAVRLYARVGLS